MQVELFCYYCNSLLGNVCSSSLHSQYWNMANAKEINQFDILNVNPNKKTALCKDCVDAINAYNLGGFNITEPEAIITRNALRAIHALTKKLEEKQIEPIDSEPLEIVIEKFENEDDDDIPDAPVLVRQNGFFGLY